jgi:hypothetical protein
MGGPRRWIGLVLILLVLGGAVFGDDRTPKPYSDDEFQSWMKDLWRAEVVAVGAFPFTLFATLEVYDTWRYFANGLSPSYAPWPFGSSSTASYTATETGWLAVSAVSFSVIIAGIDFVLGQINATPPHG